jgi:hypothetical protein
MAYRKGDILSSVIGGYDIEILDSDGDVICTLHAGGDGTTFEAIEQSLIESADGLLTHLNR